MCSTSEDDVLLTKISLPEAKAHHLLSVMKQEPQDSDDFHSKSFNKHADGDHTEPQRKILPAMVTTTPYGPTNATMSSPMGTVQHPRHASTTDPPVSRTTNQIGQSSTTNLTNQPTTVLRRTHPGVSNGNLLPVSHNVSAATFLTPQHPSVAVPNITSITPLLVSSLIPSHPRKPSEHHQQQQHIISSSLPTLINSTTQAAYGMFSTRAFTEHGFFPSQHPSYPNAPHSQPQSMAAQSNPRLSVFAQLVPRGHFPPPTASNQHNSHPLLPAFTASQMRLRFPASYGQQAWVSSPTNILPKMAVSTSMSPMIAATMTTATTTSSCANSTIPPAPQYTNKGAFGCHMNASIYGMNGSVATQTSSVPCTNVGIGQTQQDPVRTSSNGTVEAACQTMVDAANLIAITSTATATRMSTGVATQLSEKIQSIDPVITTSTSAVTLHSAPSPNTSQAEALNSGETLFWGRVLRLPDGDVQFPGLGKLHFSSPQAVLRQIRRIASSEESLSLQLPPSTVEFELPEDAQTNNWLAPTSTEFGSRKGFHVCLCCHQAFTSRALYDSHMMRPVARILYRCHLCRGIEPTYLSTTTNTNTTNTVTTSSSCNVTTANIPNHVSSASDTGINGINSVSPIYVECSNGTALNSFSSSFLSPYCTVLPGGIIKAPNRCAIYSHMACVHPHQVDRWALLPSLLTICPLSESAWSIPSFPLKHRLGITEPPVITTVATTLSSVLDGSAYKNDPGQPYGSGSTNVSFLTTSVQKINEDASRTLSEPNGISPGADITSSVVTCDSAATTSESLDLGTFYQPGMELTELWCDLERAICEAVSYQPLNFLSTFTDLIRLRPSSFGLPELALSSWFGSPNTSFTLDQRGSPSRCPLNRLLVRSDDAGSASPPLPEVNSSLAQIILLSACADTWKSHMFLTDWCQRCEWLPAASQQANTSAPIVIEDDSCDARVSPQTDGMHASTETSAVCNSQAIPPPAPSILALHEALNQLEMLRTHTISSQGNSNSVTGELETQSAAGVLRCLICQFRTTSPRQMQLHLSGEQPYTLTKCALCGQSVCIRQPNLCAVKAHLLLHLDCFLMCPQCGFTPPAHLAPDAAELCLRIHLRFVCFHYNVLQVYLCTRCQGQGKAFHSLTHLSQHFFDRHTTRMYACLWCARQPQSATGGLHSLLPASRCDGVVVTRCGTSDESTAGLERSDGYRTPDSSLAPSIDRVQTPDRVKTPPLKPVYSFVSARDLLAHLRIMHRHILTVPSASNSVAASTTNTTLAVSNTATAANPSDLEAEADNTPRLEMVEQSSTGAEPESEAVGSDMGNPSTELMDKFSQSSESLTCGARLAGDTNNPPFCLVPMVDFTCGYKCLECNQVFDSRDSFGRHFHVNHPWGYTAVCCYRCFGSCKRLSYNLDDFRRHTKVCPSARRMLLNTFTMFNRENEQLGVVESRTQIPSSASERVDPAIPSIATSAAPMRNRLSDGFHPTKHPLCFCSHCGIGARRVVDLPVANAVSATATRGLEPVNSPNESPADLVIDERDPDVPSDTRTSSAPAEPGTFSATPNTPSTTKEPTYDACYFPDLAALHAHESQLHASENNSRIACPWCGYRLSCFKRSDLKWTLRHLRSHLLKHNFASWNLERKRRWNRSVESLPHCSCGSALLDSPLALASHGSTHLLVCNPFLPRLPKSVVGASTDLSTSQSDSLVSALRLSIAPETTDDNGVASVAALINAIESHKAPMAQLSHSSHQTNVNRPLLRPGSGAHIPCSVDVYRHLRFAVFPELDHYLSCATLSAHPFLCPVCNCSLSTRWSLTEHAFIEHWGVLCFICCIHTVSSSSSSKTDGDVARRNDTSNSLVVPTDTKQSPSTSPKLVSDLVPSTQTDENPSTVPVTVPFQSTVAADAKDSNSYNVQESFWSHVHQCMGMRRQALKEAQLYDDAEDCCTRVHPASDAVHPATNKGETAVCHAKDKLPVANSTLKAPRFFVSGDSAAINSTAPIEILSSPDTFVSSDNEQLSPQSGLNGHGSCGERSIGAAGSCTGDSDHTLPCLNSGDSIHSQSLRSDPAPGALQDTSVTAFSNVDSSRRNKRRRLTLERYEGSPMSSHWSEASDARTVDDQSSYSRICVLCGKPQTPDTWEEHQMSHRNPHMLWNGLQLSNPNRIVLSPRPAKIYRCYICNARFVSRFNCRRHMGQLHMLDKSQINWDLLSESSSSALPGSGNSAPNTSLQLKTSKSTTNTGDPIRPRSACNVLSELIELSEPHHQSTNENAARPPAQVQSPSRPLRLKISSARLPSNSSHPNYVTAAAASEPSMINDSRTCVLCAIQFMSPRSLAIHKLAAHGLSD